MRVAELRAGQRIISRNAAERDVYLLVSGRVRITFYSQADARSHSATRTAGDIIGEVAAAGRAGRARADAMALEEVLIACLPPARFARLMVDEPTVGGAS